MDFVVDVAYFFGELCVILISFKYLTWSIALLFLEPQFLKWLAWLLLLLAILQPLILSNPWLIDLWWLRRLSQRWIRVQGNLNASVWRPTIPVSFSIDDEVHVCLRNGLDKFGGVVDADVDIDVMASVLEGMHWVTRHRLWLNMIWRGLLRAPQWLCWLERIQLCLIVLTCTIPLSC